MMDLNVIWNTALEDVPCAARRDIGYSPDAAFRLAADAIIEGCARIAEETAERFERASGGDPRITEAMQGARHAAAEIRALKSK